MVEERPLPAHRTRHSPADFAARLPLHRQGKKAERTSDIFFFPFIIFSTLQDISLLLF